MIAPATTKDIPAMGIAGDVTRLIADAVAGQGLDADMQGHAFDVAADIAALLSGRRGLTGALGADITARIEAFARRYASAQLHLRLLVADREPDLPDDDPSELVVYDGIENAGTSFSVVEQRATIYGTVMTSVNITDLRAYIESGKKRILVLYLGTDREADMHAHDRIMAAMPSLLAAAGLDAGAVRETMAAVADGLRRGTLPHAVLKMLQLAVQVAAVAAAPAAALALPAMQRAFAAMMAHVGAAPGMPAVFIRAFAVLAPVVAAAPRVLARALPVTLRAGNDNVLTPVKPAALRDLVRAVRTLARDRTISPADRRDIAGALRDLRAGMRPGNPAPSRIAAGVAVLARVTAPAIVAAVPPPAFAARMFPAVAAAALALAPARMMPAWRPVMAPLRSDPSLPVPARAAITRALDRPLPDQGPALARVVARHPQVAHALAPAGAVPLLAALRAPDLQLPRPAAGQAPPSPDVKNPAVPPPHARPGTPQSKNPAVEKTATGEDRPQVNADGTIKDCCRDKFASVTGGAAARSAVPAVIPQVEITRESGIVFRDAQGQVMRSYSATEIAENVAAHERLAARTPMHTPTQAQERAWAEDTLRQLRELQQPKGQDMNEHFNHRCGPGCSHGASDGFRATPVDPGPTGQAIAQRNAEIQLRRVEDDPASATTARARRTLRPA